MILVVARLRQSSPSTAGLFPSLLFVDQPGVRILSLAPGRDSQQRKLNFSWFFPQIRKYRRSLIEVLVASLVLQLLNLAQPLFFSKFSIRLSANKIDTLYTLGLVCWA